MFNNTTIKFLTASLMAAMLAGCGGNPASVDDEFYEEDPGYTMPTTPMTGTTPGYGTTTPGYGTTTPGYGTTPGYATGVDAELTASVIKKKNGVFGIGLLGGKFTCTVEVSNPGSTPRSGTLTVTFMNGSKTSKTAPIEQHVSLGANETRTFDFEDKKWSTDAVNVEITSDPVQGAATGAAAGYGGYPATGYGAAATGTAGYPATGAPAYPTY